MKKTIYTDRDTVRHAVAKGIKELADVVKVTLGPGGLTVLIETEPGKPLATKDGVTVAKHHEPTDPLMALVATAAREACERTVKEAGDGTTTAIVLADAIVKAGQKFLENNPHYSPQQLARELTKISNEEIKPAILELAKSLKGLDPEETKRAVRHVALISSNHDAEIADVVAQGVEYVGENGMVVAEEGAGSETTVKHQQGFPIFGGLANLGGSAQTAFVNRTAYSDCLLDNESGVYLVLYDGEISDFNMLIPIMQQVFQEVGENGRQVKRPVLVVAHSFAPQVLVFMARNFRSPDGLKVVPFITVRSGATASKQTFLHDLAAYVGGHVFDPQASHLQDAQLAQLGFAERIRIGQHETVIMAEPELERVEARIAELKAQIERANEFDQDRLRHRIGQLTGGISTIYAGGETALEAKERHARVVDAISAVRSAMIMGVVPGGGTTLAFISKKFEAAGAADPASVYAESLKAPFLQILSNAEYIRGDEQGQEWLDKVGPQQTSGDFLVFDSREGALREWYDGGIVDPAKVTFSALESALSVARTCMGVGAIMVGHNPANMDELNAIQDAIMKSVQGEV